MSKPTLEELPDIGEEQTKDNIFYIEIRGVYDGICVEYNIEEDSFTWRKVAEDRLNKVERDDFEHIFRKQHNFKK